MALTDEGLTRITGTVTHVGLLVSGTEVSTGGGSNYARKAITFNAVSGSVITNNGAITFANPDTAWGTVTEVGFYTAISGGDCLFSGSLTTPRSVTADTIVAFADTAISLAH